MQNLLFLNAGTFSDAHFSSRILRFLTESSFLALVMVGKGKGAFLTPKKGQGEILIFQKRQRAFLTFKKRAGRRALR